MLFVVLCQGTPEGSTGSGSGFKASQKTVPPLKVSFDRLGEAGSEPATPGLQEIGLSPTPRRLPIKSLQSPSQAQLPNTYFVIDIFQKIR